MNYKAKREAKGLLAYTVSKELNLPFKTYLKVEKGEIGLSKERLDRFLKIIDNSVKLKLEQDMKVAKVEREIKSGEFKEYLNENNISQTSINKYLDMSHSFANNILSNQGSKDNELWVYDTCYDDICVAEIKSIPVGRRGKKPTKKTNVKPKEIVETIETIKDIPTPTFETTTIVIDQNIIDNLKQENEKLKRQIMLYEKLIERL